MNKLYFVFYLSIFLPYIGITLIPSDTQPFAVLIGLLIILNNLYSTKIIKINLITLLTLIVALTAILSGLLQLYIPQYLGEKEPIYIIRGLWAYITAPIIIHAVVIVEKSKLRPDLYKLFYWFAVIISVGFLLNILGLESIIQLFVKRADFAKSLVEGRGLVGFFSEQSKVSEQIGFFYVLLLANGLASFWVTLLSFTLGLLSFAGQFFVVVTQVFLAAISPIFIRFINLRFNKLSFIYVGIITLFFLLFNQLLSSIEYLSNFNFIPSRGLDAIQVILDIGLDGLSNDVGFLAKLSGLFLLTARLLYDPLTLELGYVSNVDIINFEMFTLLENIKNTFFPSSTRTIWYDPGHVFSAFGNWVVDFGILGFIYILIFLFFVLRHVALADRSQRKGLYILTTFTVICSFLKIQLALPTLWASYGFIISGLRVNKKNINNIY